MTETLTAATFEPHKGTAFVIVSADPAAGPVSLTLADVTRGGEQPGAPRPDPFSLLFTGEAGLTFTQGVYVLDHDAVGRIEVFLVPRAPLADGLPRLEAVFN